MTSVIYVCMNKQPDVKDKLVSLDAAVHVYKNKLLNKYIVVIIIRAATFLLFWTRTDHFDMTLLQFLALLDYVSRAHEIAICPSSVIRPSVRPSSVRRPSVRPSVRRPSVRVAIISELNARISFKF